MLGHTNDPQSARWLDVLLRISGLLLAVVVPLAGSAGSAGESPPPLRGALVTAEMATEVRIDRLKSAGYTAIVLPLRDTSERGVIADREAVKRVKAAELSIYYWIEIARCPELADAHPEWMASLQGHPEWRRFHKEFPQPQPHEVVKNYPWVPVLYREAFDAHLVRSKKLLADRPAPRGLLLNDLQGSPSACGCGNPVCRWTADYGPVVTATRQSDDAAARFVAEVTKLVPRETTVIPIWTTECEEHDKANDALCAGVGCFKGICWKSYTKQLLPVADQSPLIGALLLQKQFGQDRRPGGPSGGWIAHAVKSFSEMPPKQGGRRIEAARIVAVLQGYDVTADEQREQVLQAVEAGAGGYVVAFAPIDQSWEPKMMTYKDR